MLQSTKDRLEKDQEKKSSDPVSLEVDKRPKEENDKKQTSQIVIVKKSAGDDESTEVSNNDSDSSGSGNKNKNKPVKCIDHFSAKEQMFSGGGQFVSYWSYYVIVLAMYNTLVIPVQIFYKENGHSMLLGSTVGFIDAFVDLSFLLDIVIKFRTTILDTKMSEEVKDPHTIGLRYLKGSFAIDLISSVPFSALAPAGTTGIVINLLDALGLLKLLRSFRLYDAVQRSNMSQDIKVYLKVIMMAFFLFIFIHVLSCIWFAVVSNSERWVQNMDFMYVAQP